MEKEGEHMNLYEKLNLIQQEIKVSKTHYNKFGDFYFRSCEDILEAFKPIGQKHKVILLLADDVLEKNGENYIQATARLVNLEDIDQFITVTADAREDKNKGKMDASQMTGSCSSYARKYALNGLFLLDDSKDPDEKEPEKEEGKNTVKLISPKQLEILKKNYTGDNLTKLLEVNHLNKLEDMPMQKANELISKLFEKGKENA